MNCPGNDKNFTGDVTHTVLRTLFSCALEKIGEPGDEVRTVHGCGAIMC